MLVLPTPEGPEMTMSVPFETAAADEIFFMAGGSAGLREMFKEGLALVRSKASDCTVVRDPDLFQETLCPHLAHMRHGDNNRLDFRTGNEVVLCCPLENVREAETSGLEEVLEFRTLPASFSSTRKRGSSLFLCHFWQHMASFGVHRINLWPDYRRYQRESRLRPLQGQAPG